MDLTEHLERHFPRYTEHEPAVPVWNVTPGEGRVFHRFFDSSPLSPSGRYLAAFRLPFEDRRPEPGDTGEVVLVDLHSGEQRVVAETAGWEPQLGAQVQWGADDSQLFFSDVDTATWEPIGWKLDPATGERVRLGYSCYHISPDGRWGVCGNAVTARRTQFGYGVIVPPERVPVNEGFPADDGFRLINTETGEAKLFLTLADILEVLRPHLEDVPEAFRAYAFHSKWSPQGDRLIVTVRWVPRDWGACEDVIVKPEIRFAVLTVKPDGTDLSLAVGPDAWKKGGHHINWYPDGRTLSMNLAIHGGDMCFVRVDAGGGELREILPGVLGSGHPTIAPGGRHLLTDTYAWESLARDELTPLRWLDLATGAERTLAWLYLAPPTRGDGTLRIDAHPAWDRSGRYVALNTNLGGTRRVLLADLEPALTS